MEKTGHTFGTYFKRTTSPIIVLSLLREKTMYVYELSSEMKERSAGRYTISILYPVLYRLDELGYVEKSNTEIVDGRARNYYRITASGEKYLTECLAEYNAMHKVFCELLEDSDNRVKEKK